MSLQLSVLVHKRGIIILSSVLLQGLNIHKELRVATSAQ